MRLPLFGMALLFAGSVLAHGPTPQKVTETIEIAAPPERVWTAVGDFGSIAKWNAALSSSEGSGGHASGATRTLKFPNGELLVEQLDAWDEAAHEYSYRLGKDNVKAMPASSYSGVLKVTANGAGSKVEWKARLYRGDTGNFPAENLTDEAAVAAMQQFFKTGLAGLKKAVEGGSQ